MNRAADASSVPRRKPRDWVGPNLPQNLDLRLDFDAPALGGARVKKKKKREGKNPVFETFPPCVGNPAQKNCPCYPASLWDDGACKLPRSWRASSVLCCRSGSPRGLERDSAARGQHSFWPSSPLRSWALCLRSFCPHRPAVEQCRVAHPAGAADCRDWDGASLRHRGSLDGSAARATDATCSESRLTPGRMEIRGTKRGGNLSRR